MAYEPAFQGLRAFSPFAKDLAVHRLDREGATSCRSSNPKETNLMKKLLMIGLTILAVLSSAGRVAHAAKRCTDEPKSKWMTVEAFKKQKLAEGYSIRKFKEPGTCYEIYGKDKDGNDVEIYFNPVDGSIVKKK
jgi:hypothetical protein